MHRPGRMRDRVSVAERERRYDQLLRVLSAKYDLTEDWLTGLKPLEVEPTHEQRVPARREFDAKTQARRLAEPT